VPGEGLLLLLLHAIATSADVAKKAA